MCVCVCVCFLPINSGHQVRWTYQPGSHRKKEGHTQDFSSPFLLRCLPSFFLSRRIQPAFLSLVDREVEFCVRTISSFSTIVGHFYLLILFFSEKNPVYRDRTHVPTCQKVTRLPLSYRGDRLSHRPIKFQSRSSWYFQNAHTLYQLRVWADGVFLPCNHGLEF